MLCHGYTRLVQRAVECCVCALGGGLCPIRRALELLCPERILNGWEHRPRFHIGSIIMFFPEIRLVLSLSIDKFFCEIIRAFSLSNFLSILDRCGLCLKSPQNGIQSTTYKPYLKNGMRCRNGDQKNWELFQVGDHYWMFLGERGRLETRI